MPVLATFLRKNHRALKLATLNALDVLITNYGMISTVSNGYCNLFDVTFAVHISVTHTHSVKVIGNLAHNTVQYSMAEHTNHHTVRHINNTTQHRIAQHSTA